MGLFGPSANDVADKVIWVLSMALKQAIGPRASLPADAVKDDFLLAYMLGALMNGYRAARVTNAKKQHHGAIYFFDNFFPGRGEQVLESCYSKLKSSTEFLENSKIGMRETMEFIGGNGTFERYCAHFRKNNQQTVAPVVPKEESKQTTAEMIANAVEKRVSETVLLISKCLTPQFESWAKLRGHSCPNTVNQSLTTNEACLGYCFGFADYIVQQTDLPPIPNLPLEIIRRSFEKLKYCNDAESAIDRCLDLQKNAVFHKWRMRGANDAHSWMGQSVAPVGLIEALGF